MRIGFSSRPNLLAAISAMFVLIAAGRIVLSYSHTGQAFDEPCHVAAGMEFLDKGTYILDAVHPTLARIAIALPLYLAGERYPVLPVEDPGSGNYNVIGNHVLYDSGHLLRNLTLARLGILPFFLLGGFVVYLWTRDLGSDLAVAIAVFLYATTPTILAFSSIAYTDMVAAATQVTAMFTFYRWLQRPDIRRTIVLGFALGMAFLAKLTTVLFVPAATLAIAVVWYASERKKPSRVPFATVRLLAALALAAVVDLGGLPILLAAATGCNRDQGSLHAVVPAFSAPAARDRSGCAVEESATASPGTSARNRPGLDARQISRAVVLVRSPQIRRMVVLLLSGPRSQAASAVASALRRRHNRFAEV